MATPARRASPAAPGIVYDRRARRYADAATGRFISRATVEAAHDAEAVASSGRMRALGERLSTGSISRLEFQLGMEAEIRTANIIGAAIGRGGYAQTSGADNLWTGRQIKFHLQKFEAFKRDIARGTYTKPDGTLNGRFLARLDLYGASGRSTAREMERRVAVNSGVTEARWVTTSGETCDGRGSCREQAARDWQPIGSFPRHASRLCVSNCRCFLITRRPDAKATT